MSYIKRKRDQRDYELRRLLAEFAGTPRRFVVAWNGPPANPAHDRLWAIDTHSTTEAAPNRAASFIPRRKR